jgi:hypothetical protein
VRVSYEVGENAPAQRRKMQEDIRRKAGTEENDLQIFRGWNKTKALEGSRRVILFELFFIELLLSNYYSYFTCIP